MDSYKVIERKLKELKPFKGNSMSASYDERGNYRVYSYSTEIAVKYILTGGGTLNCHKYSTTTSRHQNLVRRAWGF